MFISLLSDCRIFAQFILTLVKQFFFLHLTPFIEKRKKYIFTSSWSGLCVPCKMNLWRFFRSACGLSIITTPLIFFQSTCWELVLKEKPTYTVCWYIEIHRSVSYKDKIPQKCFILTALFWIVCMEAAESAAIGQLPRLHYVLIQCPGTK